MTIICSEEASLLAEELGFDNVFNYEKYAEKDDMLDDVMESLDFEKFFAAVDCSRGGSVEDNFEIIGPMMSRNDSVVISLNSPETAVKDSMNLIQCNKSSFGCSLLLLIQHLAGDLRCDLSRRRWRSTLFILQENASWESEVCASASQRSWSIIEIFFKFLIGLRKAKLDRVWTQFMILKIFQVSIFGLLFS